VEYSVKNKYLSITFDDEKARIISLKNEITGDEYIKNPVTFPLYKLSCIARESNIKEEFIPDRVKEVKIVEKSNTKYVVVNFEGAISGNKILNINTIVKIEIKEDDCETIWSIDVINNDKVYSVVEVLFPYIRGIYLGEDWRDNIIIYPHHAGEKTIDPIETYTTEKYLSFSRAQTYKEDGMFFREINYCGLASMNWVYYQNNKNGLYLSSYDNDFLITGLRVETGGPENPWMGFGFRKYVVISPDSEWHSREYALAVTTYDWHWGAKRYRKWIDNYIKIEKHPTYLEEEFVLNQCYNFKRDGIIYNKFEDIPELFKKGQDLFGAKHMFIASWNRQGFDQNYPEYYPDLELGTSLDLYKGCEYVNKSGGFVTFYINARIFDINSDYFNTLGQQMAIKDEKGDMKFEQYGLHKFVVLCPANEKWQKYLMDFACWMVQCYGATGIYLDQLGSAEPLPCYDQGHNHREIGDFNKGYLKVLKELLTKLRAINSKSFLMIENCGDIYSAYVWGNLTWNGEPYDEFFNLYKYTFPEYIQVHMVNPKRNLSGKCREERFHRDIARAILLGAIFWVGLDKFKDGDEELISYLKKALAFRKKLNPFFKDGKYMDDEGILNMTKGLEISRWQLKNGQNLYVVANLENASNCIFEIPAGEETDLDNAVYADIDGAEGRPECNFSNGKVIIHVPKSELSYILI